MRKSRDGGREVTRIKFVQTADPEKYVRLLEVSSQGTRWFCDANGFEYEAFVGLKHGWHPWHATFNRIDLLVAALESGFDGWLIYLDADAFVVDLTFDLSAYLEYHADMALIARASVPEDAPTWRVNAGVLMFNLRHPAAARIIRNWKRLFDLARLSGQLSVPPAWAVVDDQKLLQGLLWTFKGLLKFIHYEHPDLINGAHATFIAQFLLSDVPDMDMRVALVAERVRRAFAEAAIDPGAPCETRSGAPGFTVFAPSRATALPVPIPGGPSR